VNVQVVRVALATEYQILAAVSGAAGLALGRVIRQRVRRLLLAGGVVAAFLAAALTWASSRDLVHADLTLDLVGAGLIGAAAVLLPFSLGASLTGP
jgi:hypothetical protein